MDPVALKRLFSVLDARRAGARPDVHFPHADLRGAHLMGADLQGADLGHARLDKCKLAGARLAGAHLAGASLGGVDLTGADLRGADLTGATLSQTLLTAADLRGANLSQIKGEPSSVAGAHIDRALCDRSGFEEARVIQFAIAGARIDELSEFSQAVRDACVADEPPSSDDARTVPLHHVTKPGDVVLGVTLRSLVGNGSASIVWRGMDSDGTKVAIKLFEPPDGSPMAMHAAFVRGVRAMNRLRESGGTWPSTIVRVRRSGTAPLHLVMELAERGNMVDLPALGWPPPRIVEFFEELCRAIAFAHDAGVIHRGLKPSNILLGERFEPVVTDFDMVDLPSLAHSEDPSAGGYAAYAAPEALRGEGADNPAADIYSLGRILYFLLLGAEPPNPAEDWPALLPLRDQPAGLTRIIRQCTALDPALRYPRVSDLLADLARYDVAPDVGLPAPADSPPSSRAAAPPSLRSQGAGDAPLSRRDLPPASVRSRDDEPPAASRRKLPSGSAWSREEDAAPLSRRDLPPASVRPREGDVAPLSRRDLPPASIRRPPGPPASRRFDQTVALLGALALASLAVTLAAARVPDTDLVQTLRIAGSIGAAMATFVLPRIAHRPNAFRAVVAAAGALLFYFLDPTQLAVYRLRATLSSSDPRARAAAVRQLPRHGLRNFDGRDLSSLDLSGADLSQATFRGTSLANANLSGAALIESAFDGTDISFAKIHGADFTESNVWQAQGWELAECDGFTRFPAEWTCSEGHPARAGEGNSREQPQDGKPEGSAKTGE